MNASIDSKRSFQEIIYSNDGVYKGAVKQSSIYCREIGALLAVTLAFCPLSLGSAQHADSTELLTQLLAAI